MLLPYGVNLGSWLSLEDYFYVGNTGAVEVATPDDNAAAVCLPPLHLGQEGAPAWQSETDLLKRYVVKLNFVDYVWFWFWFSGEAWGCLLLKLDVDYPWCFFNSVYQIISAFCFFVLHNHQPSHTVKQNLAVCFKLLQRPRPSKSFRLIAPLLLPNTIWKRWPI